MRTGNIIRGVLVGGLMFPLAAGAAISGTVNIPFTITNPMPTCSLTFDGKASLSYPLGLLTRGSEKQHPAFTVSVDCPGGAVVKTAVKARNITGTLQGGEDSVIMPVDHLIASNGPLFWLEESGGGRVKLTGKDSDMLCARNDTLASSPNSCQLKPVTKTPSDAPTGNTEVTIRFDVVYPA